MVGLYLANRLVQIFAIDADGEVVAGRKHEVILLFPSLWSYLVSMEALCLCTPPWGAGNQGAWSQGSAAGLSQTLRVAWRDRRDRYFGDPSGDNQADNAHCGNEEPRAADQSHAAQDAGLADSAVNRPVQCTAF